MINRLVVREIWLFYFRAFIFKYYGYMVQTCHLLRVMKQGASVETR